MKYMMLTTYPICAAIKFGKYKRGDLIAEYSSEEGARKRASRFKPGYVKIYNQTVPTLY